MQYYHPFFWLLLRHCKFKRFTFTNIVYRRSPIVNNIGSEKCRTRTCEIAVLEAAAVATEPTSRKELGYHHSVASLSHSASVRVPWLVLLIIILVVPTGFEPANGRLKTYGLRPLVNGTMYSG